MLGAVDDAPENCFKPLVLRATFEKMGLPAEDERVRHYVTGEGKVRADLGVLGAGVHVPGVINIVDALLFCLRDIHVKNEGVLGE